jgi:hypothetical protein
MNRMVGFRGVMSSRWLAKKGDFAGQGARDVTTLQTNKMNAINQSKKAKLFAGPGVYIPMRKCPTWMRHQAI